MAPRLWTIDKAHSEIRFTVRHMVITRVRGRFRRWDGRLWLDEQDLSQSRVEITIDVASIDTSDQPRDAHLRSADFLDAQKYPHITFQSARVEAARGGGWRVAGDLTIRGVSKSVVLEVEQPDKAKDAGGVRTITFNGKVTIDREDFGARWTPALEAGGVLVSKQVEIELALQAFAPAV